MSRIRPLLVETPDRLTGERIVVRPYRDGDTQALHDAVAESREHIHRWVYWYPSHQTLDDTREYIRQAQVNGLQRTRFDLGIFEPQSERVLGEVILKVHSWDIPSFSIGYWLRRTAEGRGYAGEAAALLTDFAFRRLSAQRVAIECDTRNVRSAAVAVRLGYLLEGTLRHHSLDASGHPCDVQVYALIPADYFRLRGDVPV